MTKVIQTSLDKNPYSAKSWNLTQQGQLLKELKEKLEEICYLKAEASIEEIFKDIVGKIE